MYLLCYIYIYIYIIFVQFSTNKSQISFLLALSTGVNIDLVFIPIVIALTHRMRALKIASFLSYFIHKQNDWTEKKISNDNDGSVERDELSFHDRKRSKASIWSVRRSACRMNEPYAFFSMWKLSSSSSSSSSSSGTSGNYTFLFTDIFDPILCYAMLFNFF